MLRQPHRNESGSPEWQARFGGGVSRKGLRSRNPKKSWGASSSAGRRCRGAAR